MLVEKFPNLLDKYRDEVEWQEGNETGSRIVYGDVLAPYLIECIIKNNNVEVIKILNFIEQILEFNDKYSDEVIAFSILERIEYEYRDSELLCSNYGRLTKKSLKSFKVIQLKNLFLMLFTNLVSKTRKIIGIYEKIIVRSSYHTISSTSSTFRNSILIYDCFNHLFKFKIGISTLCVSC